MSLVRWQPLPSLRMRLRRADLGDAAVTGLVLALTLLAALAVAGVAAGAARGLH